MVVHMRESLSIIPKPLAHQRKNYAKITVKICPKQEDYIKDSRPIKKETRT